jgi:hypothetical protein
MRELHARHGDRRATPDAATDSSAAHPPGFRHQIEVLRDPEVRMAKHLEYRKKVEEAYANPSESPDKPASKIAERREPAERQEEKQRKPERSRLPDDATAQFAGGIGIAVTSLAAVLHVMPAGWDAVATSFLGAAISGVAWGNKRWKDKHGDRPKD